MRPGQDARGNCRQPGATASTCCPKTAANCRRYFAGQGAGEQPDYEIVEGLPKLANCVAFFACEVMRTVDVSDHTLFIAEVSNCDYCDNIPLVFFSSRYHLGPGLPVDH